MPIETIDVATPPQGSLPASPIAGVLTKALSMYGRTFPTAAERARMELEGTEAALNKQKLAQPGALADTTALAYGAVPDTALNPDGTKMTHDQWMQSKLPDLIRSGIDPSQLGGLFRTVLMNAPTGASQAAQANSMMGAGDPYGSSREGMQAMQTAETNRQIAVQKSANQGQMDILRFKKENGGMTDEQMNRNAKIQAIMAANGLSGAEGLKMATNIVDGVVEGGLDPVTKQPYVINKLDVMMNNKAPSTPTGQPIADNVPAAGVEYPKAVNASDIKIDFNQAYGGDSAIAKLGSMADAAMNKVNTAGPSPEVAKINDFKRGYLGIIGQSPGVRNNQAAQGLVINQLPDTGSPTDPKHIWEQALVKPNDAATAAVDAMNKVIEMRKTDADIFNNETLPPEERVSASNRMREEDAFMRTHASDELYAQYAKAAGLQLSATPQTNQSQLKAATTVNTKVPSRADFARMPSGTTFSDAKGVLWQKQPDGSAKRVK